MVKEFQSSFIFVVESES